MGLVVAGRVAGPEVRRAALGYRAVRAEGTEKPLIWSGAKTLGKRKKGRVFQATGDNSAPQTPGGRTCVRSLPEPPRNGARPRGRAGAAARLGSAERLTSECLMLSGKPGLNDLACCVGKMERCDLFPSASGSSPDLIPACFSRVSRSFFPFRTTRSTPRLCFPPPSPHLRPRGLLPLAPEIPPTRLCLLLPSPWPAREDTPPSRPGDNQGSPHPHQGSLRSRARVWLPPRWGTPGGSSQRWNLLLRNGGAPSRDRSQRAQQTEVRAADKTDTQRV